MSVRDITISKVNNEVKDFVLNERFCNSPEVRKIYRENGWKIPVGRCVYIDENQRIHEGKEYIKKGNRIVVVNGVIVRVITRKIKNQIGNIIFDESSTEEYSTDEE